MFLVDSHSHLHLLDPINYHAQLDDVVQRAVTADVRFLLNVSVDLAAFPKQLQLAERYPNVAISVGLHPNNQEETVDAATILKLSQHPKVVAIGETGLDYFRSTGEVEWQRQRFREHIQAAKQLKKPIIVHTRAAKEDTINIMREEQAGAVSGVMHCFTEDWDMAQQALDLGFYISFSGIVTFKNATVIQEVARQVPLDRMLLETDCPYLAPEPFRGKPNEPAYVRHTAEFIAKMRQISLQELAEKTTNNFFTLFKEAVKPHV